MQDDRKIEFGTWRGWRDWQAGHNGNRYDGWRDLQVASVDGVTCKLVIMETDGGLSIMPRNLDYSRAHHQGVPLFAGHAHQAQVALRRAAGRRHAQPVQGALDLLVPRICL